MADVDGTSTNTTAEGETKEKGRPVGNVELGVVAV